MYVLKFLSKMGDGRELSTCNLWCPLYAVPVNFGWQNIRC